MEAHFLEKKQLGDAQMWAFALLSGEAVILEQAELATLLAVHTEQWQAEGSISLPSHRLDFFLDKGLLLEQHSDRMPRRSLLAREQAWADAHWNIYAALYHGMSRWQYMDSRLPFLVNSAEVSLPVPPASPPQPHTQLDLSEPLPEDDFFSALAKRKTCREFDSQRPLTRQQLAYLCQGVFGTSSQRRVPSASGRYPIKPYLLVLRVSDLEPGIYQYEQDKKQLLGLRRLNLPEAESLVREFAVEHAWASDAHCLFMLTSDFAQIQSSYQHHNKAYLFQVREAAYYSQTFFLLCAHLGLGSFTTVANDRNIEAALGLDGFTEGHMHLLGCGVPTSAS